MTGKQWRIAMSTSLGFARLILLAMKPVGSRKKETSPLNGAQAIWHKSIRSTSPVNQTDPEPIL